MVKRAKITLIFLMLCIATVNGVYAESLKITLRKPPKHNRAALSVPKILPAQKIAGTVIIGTEPQLVTDNIDRYIVEYYLADELLYKTSGKTDVPGDLLDFSYELDTTQYANGSYRLYINVWDSKGPPEIGSRDIIINNPQSL